jgi:hypothetical protein
MNESKQRSGGLIKMAALIGLLLLGVFSLQADAQDSRWECGSITQDQVKLLASTFNASYSNDIKAIVEVEFVFVYNDGCSFTGILAG